MYDRAHKHNSTMVSDASPGTAAPNMNKYFVHMAHVSSDHAFTQDGYLKRPHPAIIDGDMRWDSGWFLAGFGIIGEQCVVAWQQNRRNRTRRQVFLHNWTSRINQSWWSPLSYGHHGAPLLALKHTTISNHTMQQKTKFLLFINIYTTI